MGPPRPLLTPPAARTGAEDVPHPATSSPPPLEPPSPSPRSFLHLPERSPVWHSVSLPLMSPLLTLPASSKRPPPTKRSAPTSRLAPKEAKRDSLDTLTNLSSPPISKVTSVLPSSTPRQVSCSTPTLSSSSRGTTTNTVTLDVSLT